MGWNPFKGAEKVVKKAGDIVEDTAKAATAAWYYPSKLAVDTVKTVASMVNGYKQDAGDSTPDTTLPEQKITDAKADSVKRRRALYATKGGSLGEEVERVGDTFGNGRGTLFGN